jgi:hypothetical protein
VDLRALWETADGSRPDPTPLSDDVARRLPLVAFPVLRGGDSFEGGAPATDAAARARRFVDEHVVIERHRQDKALSARVAARLAQALSGNVHLPARLRSGPRIEVDLVPPGGSFVALGYPAQVLEHAAGLFWGDRRWPAARIALRAERIDSQTALVEHELAHAVFSLAFTKAEQELVYGVLRPVLGSRAMMDEAFAIYAERELVTTGWSDLDQRAPGVYGFVRRQWSEDHVFTRFVRKLWFPHKPLAGPRPAIDGHRRWSKFAG